MLIASSFKPFSKVQSVLFHPPPVCHVFSRRHDSTQNCFRGIGQSKAGWRKRSKKRLQHTESTGLGHTRGQAEGLDHKGFCCPIALSVARAHRYELWMCQFGAGADGIETPWLGRHEVQVSSIVQAWVMQSEQKFVQAELPNSSHWLSWWEEVGSSSHQKSEWC